MSTKSTFTLTKEIKDILKKTFSVKDLDVPCSKPTVLSYLPKTDSEDVEAYEELCTNLLIAAQQKLKDLDVNSFQQVL